MEEYLNIKGRIFDIQRFSLHDGPGIRTIVFFKGCYLRCRWCCNPEGQRYEIESMLQNGKNKVIGKDITVKEVLDIVERDRAYYRRSSGGVTLSGGECLAQIEFAKGILMGAKALGLTTSIETTSFTSIEKINEILPYVDTYLMDIKHINSKKHEEFTSKPNELILENARILASKTNLIARTPVIPTFNDTDEEIKSIAEFIRSSSIKEWHLLPYHRLGKDKYTGLNREYEMGNLNVPTNERMQELLHIAHSYNIKAQIGG